MSRRTLYSFITVLLAVLFQPAFSLRAQDLAERESRKDKLEREIAILESQLKSNSKKSSSALSSLSLIQKKISVRKKLLSDSERELRIINDSLTATQRQINRLNARLDSLELYYSRLVHNAYKNRDPRIWYMYILASGNVSQAVRRYSYLKGLSANMNSQAVRIKQVKEELDIKKARLSEMKVRSRKLRDDNRKALDALLSEEKQSKSLISQLNRNKTTYQKQLASKKRQVENLNKEIEKLIASSMKSGGKSGKKEIDYVLSGEFEQNKGKLPWPAEGPVIEKFGLHAHPVYKKVQMPFNNGINIAVDKSSPVKAVFSGVVKQIIVMPGYNQCVLVQHGKYFTFYCKLGSVNVKAGQKVSTGDVIGRVDTIGGDTQLHFQLWKEKTPQDPELWLR